MCVGLALPMFAQQKLQMKENIKRKLPPSTIATEMPVGEMGKRISQGGEMLMMVDRWFKTITLVTFNAEGEEIIIENPATMKVFLEGQLEKDGLYLRQIGPDGNYAYTKLTPEMVKALLVPLMRPRKGFPQKKASFGFDVFSLLLDARLKDESWFERVMTASATDFSEHWSAAQKAALYAVAEGVLTVQNVDAQDPLFAFMEEKLGNYSNLDLADKEEFLAALEVCQDITQKTIQQREREYEEFAIEDVLTDIETLRKVLEHLENVEKSFQ